MTADAPTAIIGAGPHGLAAAAHLRGAGVRTVSFGQPLEFWRQHMPAGMLLRSRKRSSNIADPGRSLTIAGYERAHGRPLRPPLESLPLEDFIDYGLWFQRQVVPDLDVRRVTRVGLEDDTFRLRLTDGEELEAERVVIAAGLAPFPHIPAPFTGFTRELVSHACHHNDLRPFRGAHVAVVGAGQSALESAALLAESGATVEVLVRRRSVRWLADSGDDRAPRLRDHVPRPPTDVGGVVEGWLAAAPDAFRRLPQRLQPRLAYRCIRPAGSGWLRPRLGSVQIECDRHVTGAEPRNGTVRLILSDGSERVVDHVVLGTGYEIDVRRYAFLAAELSGQVRVRGGYPVLGPGLESSVPRLHFLGAPAALSFGPIMRFVVGSWYAAPALTRRVVGRDQPMLRFSF